MPAAARGSRGGVSLAVDMSALREVAPPATGEAVDRSLKRPT